MIFQLVDASTWVRGRAVVTLRVASTKHIPNVFPLTHHLTAVHLVVVIARPTNRTSVTATTTLEGVGYPFQHTACYCKYMGAWTCSGHVVRRPDMKSSFCIHPDKSRGSCELGGGDCGAY